tara:strand:+ start:59669 stop:60175 length:507 start_codon:yes stop_codon:yes gene_type:complete
MSNQDGKLGHIPDVFKFAYEQRRLSGEVKVAAFERLADLLTDQSGVIRYKLEGDVDAMRKPRLTLTIDGSLMLRCQRCLGGLGWDLSVRNALQPVRSGQEIPEEELEDDEVDAIEIDGDLDVLSLLEDEILLALPLAPRHDECGTLRPEGGAVKESPFSVLSGLRAKN